MFFKAEKLVNVHKSRKIKSVEIYVYELIIRRELLGFAVGVQKMHAAILYPAAIPPVILINKNVGKPKL
jgi:hypothetical protein